jgi:hypothetical protein
VAALLIGKLCTRRSLSSAITEKGTYTWCGTYSSAGEPNIDRGPYCAVIFKGDVFAHAARARCSLACSDLSNNAVCTQNTISIARVIKWTLSCRENQREMHPHGSKAGAHSLHHPSAPLSPPSHKRLQIHRMLSRSWQLPQLMKSEPRWGWRGKGAEQFCHLDARAA